MIALQRVLYINLFFVQYRVALHNSCNYNTLSSSVLTTNATPFNTAVGSTGLTANPAGVKNTAVGYQALNALTTGGSCTAVGYQSLLLNTTGSFNEASGNSTLSALTTGSNNTALGYLAGSSYTAAESSNICIGSNTTGTGGESNTLRIGTGTGTGTGQLNSAFIQGIQGLPASAMANGQVIAVGTTGQIAGNFNIGTVSFSATLGDGTTNFTLGANSNFYFQVGNVIFVNYLINWTSTTGASGAQLRLSLPFTTPAGVETAFVVGPTNGFGSTNAITAVAPSASNFMEFFNTAGGSSAAIAANSVGGTGTMRIGGFFLI